MRTILLSFDEKWYPVLKSGEKIFEHRRKFCNEEVRAFVYLGKPRQQIVAEIGLGKRELLEDWLQQYQEEKEVADRISDFMRRNKFAMKVLWFKEIEPINIIEVLELFPELIIATVYKGNIIKNLIMDCQSYTKYRPNETTGGIFVSWRRKEELPTGA